MYVKIGKYPEWIGPYQIAEKLLFWLDKHEDRRVHKFGEFLAHGFAKEDGNASRAFSRDERPKTILYKVCEWISSKNKQKIVIKLDPWDSWNVDSTLSPIILPLLKQLKATKHGSGFVAQEDLPPHLQFTETEDYDSQKCFEFYHETTDENKLKVDIHVQYEWVLDEIIWAFEQLQPDYDWEDQYRSGEHDMIWVPSGKLDENGEPTMFTMENGPKNTYVCDYEAMAKHQARINNGLRLFGVYFLSLWD